VCGLAVTLLLVAGCTGPDPDEKTRPAAATGTAVAEKPSKPQVLNVVDLIGELRLTQGILDNFQREHSDVVSKIVTSNATAAEIPAKLKADHRDIDLVLTGTDGLTAGLAQGLWTRLTPAYDARLPALKNVYTEDAARMQALTQGYGVTVAESPAGPLIMYNPKTVPTPPTTAQELLAYAKEHPQKVEYAQPRDSWPARAMLMGLPYLLGDRDPKNPSTWRNTWDYLAEMAPYNPAFPAGTGQTMTDLTAGTVDIVVTTTGWDINSRALGTVPAEMKVAQLKGSHWIMDAQYAVVPKGVDTGKLAAILSLIRYLLQPKQQAITFDKGFFYPGPAVGGATIDLAPADSQDVVKKFGRPEYDGLIKNSPKETPLAADAEAKAFDLWDERVGSIQKK
jgi:putative spermidine/putrescine transport system substrate-binding protein